MIFDFSGKLRAGLERGAKMFNGVDDLKRCGNCGRRGGIDTGHANCRECEEEAEDSKENQNSEDNDHRPNCQWFAGGACTCGGKKKLNEYEKETENQNSKEDDELYSVQEIIKQVNRHAASSLNTWELSPEDFSKIRSKLSKFKKLSIEEYGDLVGITYVLKNKKETVDSLDNAYCGKDGNFDLDDPRNADVKKFSDEQRVLADKDQKKWLERHSAWLRFTTKIKPGSSGSFKWRENSRGGNLTESSKVKCPECNTVQTWGEMLSYGACKKKSCDFMVSDEAVGLGLTIVNSDVECELCGAEGNTRFAGKLTKHKRDDGTSMMLCKNCSIPEKLKREGFINSGYPHGALPDPNEGLIRGANKYGGRK